MDLRDRPVELGLAQVRLEVDDLVEILDGEHVILEIQGIPPDRGDAVGVQLGRDLRRKGQKSQQEYYE